MKKVIVFFLYSTTGGIFVPQSTDETVEYEGILERNIEKIKEQAKKQLKKRIGVHADNAVVTGMTQVSSVY